jgi:hypothetical protein
LTVLAAAAALSVGTPARGPLYAPAIAPGPATSSTQVEDLLESMTLTPNAVGQSELKIEVIPTRRPALPVSGVTAALIGPHDRYVAARSMIRTELGNEWLLGGVELPVAGRWQIQITVFRPGRAAPMWIATDAVGTAPIPGGSHLFSDQPWERALDVAAGALFVLTAGLLAVHAGRRRTRVRNAAARVHSEGVVLMDRTGVR